MHHGEEDASGQANRQESAISVRHLLRTQRFAFLVDRAYFVNRTGRHAKKIGRISRRRERGRPYRPGIGQPNWVCVARSARCAQQHEGSTVVISVARRPTRRHYRRSKGRRHHIGVTQNRGNSSRRTRSPRRRTIEDRVASTRRHFQIDSGRAYIFRPRRTGGRASAANSTGA